MAVSRVRWPWQFGQRRTPQGGVISPLLSNAYLHWLDKLFMEPSGPGGWAGARIVRYADDFQVFAYRLTPQIKAWITDFVEPMCHRRLCPPRPLLRVESAGEWSARSEQPHTQAGEAIQARHRRLEAGSGPSQALGARVGRNNQERFHPKALAGGALGGVDMGQEMCGT